MLRLIPLAIGFAIGRIARRQLFPGTPGRHGSTRVRPSRRFDPCSNCDLSASNTPIVARTSRRWTTSRWRSPPGILWPSSARVVAGRARCCSYSAACFRHRPARSTLTGNRSTTSTQSTGHRCGDRRSGLSFRPSTSCHTFGDGERADPAPSRGRRWCGADGRRHRFSLERVGLADRLDHKPSELSVGQQQRVALARMLANDPAVILADEPTGNLDPDTSETILAFLEELNREGRTIVMVTHDLRAARRAKRILKLVDGSVSLDGRETSVPA